MKKRVFKILSTTALVTALLTPSVFAEEPKISSDVASITTFEQLDKRFNLETTTEIPEGVIPLKFDTIQEAAEYLEASEKGLVNSNSEVNISEIDNQPAQVALSGGYVINRVGTFRATDEAKLSANLGYEKTSNGLINLVSVNSSAIGNGAWSWKQKSYTSKPLDGGRSLMVYITGVLTKTIVVGGVPKKTDYNETVAVEI